MPDQENTITVRVVKEIDDDGEIVPFTDPVELEQAMQQFRNEVDGTEWFYYKHLPPYWTVIVDA